MIIIIIVIIVRINLYISHTIISTNKYLTST